MLARLRRSAEDQAQAALTREVAELRKAWGTIETVLSRLPRSVQQGLGDARKSLTRSLVALRRYGDTEPDKEKSKKSQDPR